MVPDTFVFFDVDGVLIDGYHHNLKYRRMWSGNIDTDLGINKDHVAQYFKTYWADVIVGRTNLYDTMTTHLTAMGYDISAQTVIDYWMSHDAVINQQVWDIAGRLAARPNTMLYLATNQEKTRADYLWNTLNFKSIFKDMFYSGKMGITKDNPVFFKAINDRLALNLDQTRVVYFDDTPACLQSARDAGWREVVEVDGPDAVEQHEYIFDL